MTHTPAAGTPTTVLISTGGTIAAHTTDNGAVPALGSADLLAAAGTTPTGTTCVQPAIRTVDLMSMDSSAMTVADQFAVVHAIADALADPAVRGVVVTHGTDTMEETAFLADLFAADERPVVFTGAMLPSDALEADGPSNLAAALAAVDDAATRGRGVLVAMGGRLLPARGLFKVSTTDLAAFDTVQGAELVDAPPVPRRVLTGPMPVGRAARVDAFTLYPGVSPGLIAASVAQNATGLVLAATGSGNTHPDITAEVALAVQHGVTVVVTSRVPYGEVTATYGGGGGAVDLRRAGAIVSPWLRAPQARMALIALLTTGHDSGSISEFFLAPHF